VTVTDRMTSFNLISTEEHMKKPESAWMTFNLLSSPGHGIPGFSGMLGNTRQKKKDREK